MREDAAKRRLRKAQLERKQREEKRKSSLEFMEKAKLEMEAQVALMAAREKKERQDKAKENLRM